jgi:hypothetical protein
MPAVVSPKSRRAAELPVVQSAFETLAQIEREAQERKQSQVAALESARAKIQSRLDELTHQLVQIDHALELIAGKPKPSSPGRIRRNLNGIREQEFAWLQGQAGQNFLAGEIVRQFPELEGTSISTLLKPLVQEQKIQVDASEGPKRPRYFVLP